MYFRLIQPLLTYCAVYVTDMTLSLGPNRPTVQQMLQVCPKVRHLRLLAFSINGATLTHIRTSVAGQLESLSIVVDQIGVSFLLPGMPAEI